jgi:glycosyltransferase involved in cell wall biosynthesis
MTELSNLRVAIVHEWFVTHAGSEKVVEELLKIFPKATLFATVDFLADSERGFLGGRSAKTTFIQHLPGARSHFRNYLPLMPLAIEQLDLSDYDLVISSSHAVAKGVITGPDQLHVCYVHSPMRYAWDLQHQYLKESGLRAGLKSWLARAMLHYLRMWDQRTANGVDVFAVNSAYIGRRVLKAYGRRSSVIYPPVDIERFALNPVKQDYYLAASRMVPYKRMPVIVEAFRRMPGRRILVVGDGPDLARVKEIAQDCPHIEVLGYQPDAQLVELMQQARAFVFAAEEDFGITPVEAQACGTPVIAFGRGGALETVRGEDDAAEPTGTFFWEQTPEAVIDAIARFESSPPPDPAHCRANAERFSRAAFRASIERLIQDQMDGSEGRARFVPVHEPLLHQAQPT